MTLHDDHTEPGDAVDVLNFIALLMQPSEFTRTRASIGLIVAARLIASGDREAQEAFVAALRQELTDAEHPGRRLH